MKTLLGVLLLLAATACGSTEPDTASMPEAKPMEPLSVVYLPVQLVPANPNDYSVHLEENDGLKIWLNPSVDSPGFYQGVLDHLGENHLATGFFDEVSRRLDITSTDPSGVIPVQIHYTFQVDANERIQTRYYYNAPDLIEGRVQTKLTRGTLGQVSAPGGG